MTVTEKPSHTAKLLADLFPLSGNIGENALLEVVPTTNVLDDLTPIELQIYRLYDKTSDLERRYISYRLIRIIFGMGLKNIADIMEETARKHGMEITNRQVLRGVLNTPEMVIGLMDWISQVMSGLYNDSRRFK